MPDLKKLLSMLERHHGKPPMPPANGPFEWVMWENACYLLPDERRAAVFEGLRTQVGLTPEAIWKAPKEILMPLATLGGMQPETRVLRWQEIAHITLQQFNGDLNQILRWEYAKARRALQQFPGIGEPGAEKILMYCGLSTALPLESNGLRVLMRVGYGNLHAKNYSAKYKSVQDAVAPELPRGAGKVARAHLVLRAHGKSICRDATPQCAECPVSGMCAFYS